MKIIKCHIDNFGKLSNQDFEFKDGLNIINEENGWGKTTFAAFLKAMFYGLDYSRSKKLLVDRTKYLPWNEGKFGGNLTFEFEGKKYRIVRTFGKKESEDTCVIYDIEKNQESSQYTANIGEEIWKVDRDSYEKTAFITLKEFDLLNDIISGKLGDIDEQEADMEASSKAIATLERNINRLDSKRSNSTGSIREKREELSSLKIELDNCVAAGQEVQEKERLIHETEVEKQRITELISGIEDLQIKRQLMTRKKMLMDLKKECKEAIGKYQEIHDFFGGKVPTDKEVYELESCVQSYNASLAQCKNHELSPEEQQQFNNLSMTFTNTVPSKEELENYTDLVTQITVLESKINHLGMALEEEKKLEELDKVYSPIMKKEINVDQLINDYIGANELEKRAAMYQADLDKAREMEGNKKKSFLPLLILSIIITSAGVGMLFMNVDFLISVVTGAIGAIGVIVSSILTIVNSNKNKRLTEGSFENADELSIKLDAAIKTRDQLKVNYMEFLKILNLPQEDVMNTLLSVKAEVQEYRHLMAVRDIANQNNHEAIIELGEKQLVVDSFLERFVDMDEVISRKKTIAGLTMVVDNFTSLEAKQKKYTSLCEYANDWEKAVIAKLSVYFQDIPEKYSDGIEQIKFNIQMLKEKHSGVLKEKERYDIFAEENDIELLESIDLDMDLSLEYQEQIRNEKNHLIAEKEANIDKISGLKKDIELLLIKADLAVDVEGALERTWEEINVLEEQVQVMKIAKECMVKAKENLAEKYMGNITLAFDKFRKFIEEQELEQYHIDLGLNVKIEQDGMLHSSEVLSKGKNDLMQICMRLALVEAVYKDVETPTLILDDPFVNLDNKRLLNATKLLEELGKEQQLIYFVCHSSRII